MTDGQIKAAAFVDELSKLAAVDPRFGTAVTGMLGAVGLYKHGPWGPGGRSKGEAEAQRTVQELEQQDQEDPQALKSALSNQRNAARGAELAGGWLGAAGVGSGGLYAANRLAKHMVNAEKLGPRTAPEDVIALHSDLTKQLGYGVPTTFLPESDLTHGLSIPKGGVSPRIMKNMEADKYVPHFIKRLAIARKLINPDLEETESDLAKAPPIVARAKKDALRSLETGHVFAPLNAGPHITAHEFGHQAFRGSGVGKLTNKVRFPASLVGNIAGLTTATAADPDSTASKLSPLMSAAGIAPIIGDEAMASINAIKAMKRTGFSPQQLSLGKKQLAKAFGTYALGLALPSIATPYIIRKVKQHNQARRERQGLESSGQLQQRINSLPQAQE